MAGNIAPDRLHTGINWVCIAGLAGAHGVRGEVRLKPYTEDPRAFAGFDRLFIGPGERHIRVDVVKPIKDGFAVRIPGVEDREAAEALKGKKLFVQRADMPEPSGADEFYRVDLIGMEARDFESGHRIGTVERVENYGAGDLVELLLDQPVKTLGRSVMLPFSRRFVPEVSLNDGYLAVRFDDWFEAPSDAAADGAENGGS